MNLLKNLLAVYLFTFPLILLAPASQANENKLKDKIKAEKPDSKKDAGLNKPIQINLNQTAFIKSEALKIKFVKVVEDSRCPANAQCIWAGEIIIKINVIKDKKNLGDLELTQSNSPDLSTKKIGQYTIKLESVMGGRDEPKDNLPYSILITVSK